MYTLKKSHEMIDNIFVNREYDRQDHGIKNKHKYHADSSNSDSDYLSDSNSDSSNSDSPADSKLVSKSDSKSDSNSESNSESYSDTDFNSESNSDSNSESNSDSNSESYSESDFNSYSDTDSNTEGSQNDLLEEQINTIYEYDGKKYMIDNEKFLQKRFDDIKSDISYKMNLCIYKCIRNGCTPYLLYLMIYDDLTKTYLLPNYNIILLDNQIPTSNSLSGNESIDESVDSIEENIMNFFKEKLFDIYPPNTNKINYDDFEDSTDIYNEELFKGFFLHENEITMVYDATRINVPLESNNYCWVSPYEIFISKKVKSIPISDSVEKIFDEISLSGSQNNVDFYHLKDVISNRIIKTPYILFMCKQIESSKSGFMLFDLFNTKKMEYSTVEYENDNENESIIFPTIQHPKLGNYVFFSSLPLKTSNLVKRFAVFVDTDELNPLYLEPSENDTLLTIYDFDKDIEQYTSVTFIEKSIQLWCVKSCLYFSEMPDLLNSNE
jgi:hypothetical protein